MNDKLRKECKLLKALQGVSYAEIAEYLEIGASSLYNWLCGSYDFGEEKQRRLSDIIATISEVEIE